MSIVSMTGFGRGEAVAQGFKVMVELSSVNRRQFDCQIQLPREWSTLEAGLQKIIRATIQRGQVKCQVRTDLAKDAATAPGVGLTVNLPRARAQIAALRQAARQLDLTDDLSTETLLRLPGLVDWASPANDPQDAWPNVRQAATIALRNLKEMRQREGQTLQRDLDRRLKTLRTVLTRLKRRVARTPDIYRANLAKRMAQIEGGITLDPSVVARELAIYADRSDVSEEITRLESHLDQATRLLNATTPAGRPLDFLCQELLREINTVGSKSGDKAISRAVIDFKTRLEAAREQIQNIE